MGWLERSFLRPRLAVLRNPTFVKKTLTFVQPKRGLPLFRDLLYEPRYSETSPSYAFIQKRTGIEIAPPWPIRNYSQKRENPHCPGCTNFFSAFYTYDPSIAQKRATAMRSQKSSPPAYFHGSWGAGRAAKGIPWGPIGPRRATTELDPVPLPQT